MVEYTLLPADNYIVVNKTILSDFERKTLISFYEPIIGPISTALYLILWNDLDQNEMFSNKLNHHHLMSLLKCNIKVLKEARESLEAVGLLKTYVKENGVNEFIYELYSPLTPREFFNHPIFNVVLFNNIGKEEYERLKVFYETPKMDLKDYVDITKKMDEVYKSEGVFNDSDEIKDITINGVSLDSKIDFDLIISSMPKDIINTRAFGKKTRELITQLSFVYNVDTNKMIELIRASLNEFGMIDKTELRNVTRKFFEFNNNTLPTLVYRSQPEYLKTPEGDTSMRGKIIAIFENTTPYDFLKNKNRGINPTSRDLKLLETLLIDMELSPAVVNVLIDFVLKKNNNRLVKNYVETIASQWKRANLKTAKEAMEFAEAEHKRFTKKVVNKTTKSTASPVWFGKDLKEENLTDEEEEELKDMFKEFE